MAQKMYVKDLVGMDVIGPRGWKLGKVENIAVDTSSWRISEIEVKLESEVAERLKMKRLFRSTVLPIGTDRITGVGNVVSVTYDQADVDNLMASQDSPKKQEGAT